MWLRRQDELNERHGTDRFTTAIRVLSRRPSALARRFEAAMTAEHAIAEHGAEPHTSWTLIRRDRARALARSQVRAQHRQRRLERKRARDESALRVRPRSTLLARRRRVVSVLFLTFTVGSALTGVVGVAWSPLPAISGLLLSFYIGHLRVQDRRRLEAKLRRRLRTGAASRHEAGQAPREATSTAADRGVGCRPGPKVPRDPYEGEPPGMGHARDGWQPVPVPLPTYVTAPVAPRVSPAVGMSGPARQAADRRVEPEAPPEPPAVERRLARSAELRQPVEPTPLFDQYDMDGVPEHRIAAGE
jgi:hypothetical protein